MLSTIYAHNAPGAMGHEAWSCIIALPDGNLFAVVSDGLSHTGNDTVVKGFTSLNGGDTWSGASLVWSEPNTRCTVNSGSLFLLPDNSLCCVITREANGTLQNLGAKIIRLTGNTWGEYAVVDTPSGYTNLNTYGEIRLIGDTYYMPAYAQKNNRWDSLILKSVTGNNWTLHAVIAAGNSNLNFNEASFIQTAGSQWLAFVRCETNPTSIYKVTSNDSGKTWGTPLIWKYNKNVSPAIFRASNTRLFVGYAQRQSPFRLYIDESLDGGLTWASIQWATQSDWDFGYPVFVNVKGELKYVFYTSAFDVVCYSFDPVVTVPYTPIEEPCDCEELPSSIVVSLTTQINGQIYIGSGTLTRQ